MFARCLGATGLLAGLILALIGCPAGEARAMPEYATETGLACIACHEDGAGAGPLTELGEEYLTAGYVPPSGLAEPSHIQRWFRGLIRYVHLVGAVIWFGAIIYIHMFTKPRSLIKGLPRGEVRLGLCSMIVMAATGSLLTLWRLDSIEELWITRFGIIWMIKIAAFLGLVAIGAVATTVLDRRMRRDAEEEGGEGACGHVRFAFEGTLYDATNSKSWKGGVHAGRHRAGTDLTAAMADAPHGPEVFERITAVGRVPEGCCATLPRAARVFVTLAYVNLILIAIVLFCVSFWQWGPSAGG